MSRLTISIDWGGTELKGACFNESGLVRDFRFPSGNLRAVDAAGCNAICLKLRDMAAALPGRSHLWLIGAAGADDLQAATRLKKTLSSCDSQSEDIEIFSDYACNHAACLAGGDGILSINGTGSVLYGVNGEKKARIGGWGYLLDETPSGSLFGKRAIEGVLRHLEGESGYTAFAHAWERRFDKPDRRHIIDELYRSSGIQNRLGTFAPVLTDAFDADNKAASRMLIDSVNLLARSLTHLMQQLAMSQTETVGSGGLWAGWPPFQKLVAEACRQHKLDIIWKKRACELFMGPLILHAKTDYASADLKKLLITGVKQ